MLAKGNCNKTVISSGSEGSAGSAASAVSRNAVPQISLIHLIEGSSCSRPQTILKQLEEWHVIHCFLRPIRRDLPSSSFLCAKSILTWPVSMQIYWDKRKNLHKKRFRLPQDFPGTPSWPPFHCFGTPIWQPWRHVKTLYCFFNVYFYLRGFAHKFSISCYIS